MNIFNVFIKFSLNFIWTKPFTRKACVRSTNSTSCDPDPHQLVSLMNKAFLAPTKDFNPLPPNSPQRNVDEDTTNFQVTEFQVFKSLSTLNSSKSMGPDGIPGWVFERKTRIF